VRSLLEEGQIDTEMTWEELQSRGLVADGAVEPGA